MTPFFFEDSTEVAALFDRNAFYYDWVNSVICLGQDAGWRRWAARRALTAATPVAAGARPPRILDACGGTGLVAMDLARRGAQVTLADGSEGMLAVARERLGRAGLTAELAKVDLTAVDGAALPGAPFDAVTVAFGLRYFEDPAALLRRLAAALRPGGAIVILESVVPPAGLLSAAAGGYFFHVAPRLGALLARARRALRPAHPDDPRFRLGPGAVRPPASGRARTGRRPRLRLRRRRRPRRAAGRRRVGGRAGAARRRRRAASRRRCRGGRFW